jgi:hypothetical protein
MYGREYLLIFKIIVYAVSHTHDIFDHLLELSFACYRFLKHSDNATPLVLRDLPLVVYGILETLWPRTACYTLSIMASVNLLSFLL